MAFVSAGRWFLALFRASCQQSIKDLGCEYLDIYLMHWPDAWVPGSDKEPDNTVTILDTW